MKMSTKVNSLSRNKFFKYGLPFLILMVGGSFGLKEFTALRYQFSKKRLIKPEDMEKIGIPMKSSKEITLEAEFDKVKKIDIDHWENIRGPRPWEENNSVK